VLIRFTASGVSFDIFKRIPTVIMSSVFSNQFLMTSRNKKLPWCNGYISHIDINLVLPRKVSLTCHYKAMIAEYGISVTEMLANQSPNKSNATDAASGAGSDCPSEVHTGC
jgi:hypothetical protein